MEEHKCLYEGRWGKLETLLDLFVEKVSKHVEDGDKVGGFRDRILLLEKDITELKKRFWWSSAVGGIIGALLGAGSKDILLTFIHWLMGR